MQVWKFLFFARLRSVHRRERRAVYTRAINTRVHTCCLTQPEPPAPEFVQASRKWGTKCSSKRRVLKIFLSLVPQLSSRQLHDVERDARASSPLRDPEGRRTHVISYFELLHRARARALAFGRPYCCNGGATGNGLNRGEICSEINNARREICLYGVSIARTSRLERSLT